ncbi:MAG: ROK family protein [Bacteroidales bacterium]|nr:ROK family protein [Bacteroidales bacterium]MDD4670980.1 ROK family protein [Bacteroidales bacterium]
MKYIGIDLGGTKVAGAVFNENGEILLQKSSLLNDRTGKDVGNLVCEFCADLCIEGDISHSDKKSIGVCIPGISYSATGCVWAPNIPGWDNYPLREQIMTEIPNATVTIESDRTCYILGETTMGCAKGCRNAVFIAVGTGIGAGILIDNQVLHGNSDIVGAIGWLALKPPYLKKYDQCGCFESHCSGEGLATQARYFLKEDKQYCGQLRNYKIKDITSYHIFQAYKEGDPIAVRVIDQAIEMWGMAAANLVSIFNPEKVIFGGGVFGPASRFIGRIKKEASKWAQPISMKQVEFTKTQLPKLAGLYGAGAVAIKFAK